MDPIFQAVRYVATPLTLVAFVVAVAAYVLRARLAEQRKIVEAAAPETRVEIVDRLFRDFGQVPTADLSREQRYKLAMRLIAERQGRFRGVLAASLVVTVLLAALIVTVSVLPRAPTALSIRLHGPGGVGDVIDRGKVTASQGASSWTMNVTAEAPQVVFPLPVAPSPRAPVRVLSTVAGFRARSDVFTALPPDGVVDVGLEPDEAETEVRGTVKDLRSNDVLPGVVLDFQSGRALATSDQRGDFSTRFRARSGEKISVSARLGQSVGFNGFVTLTGQALTVYFDRGEK